MFISIVLTKNIELLIISGAPSRQELEEAWQAILNEFIDLTKSEKSENIMQCWRNMLYTKCKIDFIDSAINALRLRYDNEIALALLENGYNYIQPLGERKEYLKQLIEIETEAKFLVVRMNQLNNEYQLLAGTGNEAEQRTEADYQKELAILSKFMGQRIKKNKITVAEFASYVNLYIESNKASKTKTNE